MQMKRHNKANTVVFYYNGTYTYNYYISYTYMYYMILQDKMQINVLTIVIVYL